MVNPGEGGGGKYLSQSHCSWGFSNPLSYRRTESLRVKNYVGVQPPTIQAQPSADVFKSEWASFGFPKKKSLVAPLVRGAGCFQRRGSLLPWTHGWLPRRYITIEGTSLMENIFRHCLQTVTLQLYRLYTQVHNMYVAYITRSCLLGVKTKDETKWDCFILSEYGNTSFQSALHVVDQWKHDKNAYTYK